ncbi:MAG: hypothetical protein K8H86_13590 [Ignavibacteriaceae bacterium]|nr:hypothetical protein [Ignavibacteriaceae bacterium]
MRGKLENYFSMLRSVDGLLKLNTVIVDTVAAFKRAALELSGLLTEVSELETTKPSTTTGKTEKKQNAKYALCEAGANLCSAIRVYAEETEKPDLLMEARYTESDFKRMRDTELPDKAGAVKNLATQNLAVLADYGVDQAEIDSLAALITAYNAAMGEKDDIVADSIYSTEALDGLADKGRAIIKRLDLFTDRMQTKQPEFCGKYLTARRIIDVGIRHEAPAEPPQ